MNVTGILLFLAGLTAAFCQGVKELDGTNKSVVCVKNDMILKLTIVQGEDGEKGRPGLKGNRGDRGQDGDPSYFPGDNGPPGITGLPGYNGEPGDKGDRGLRGPPGPPAHQELKGTKGDVGKPGKKGPKGDNGVIGETGFTGYDGQPGLDGLPRPTEEMKDLFIHALNDYQVTESGYYNNLYHVKSRDLTDNKTGTGGWGSRTAKTGNYIQATFLRPVFVTSVTVAGGFIPSWGHDIRQGYGILKLEYSIDGKNWKTSITFPSPVVQRMLTIKLRPVTAQHWRLISSEDKWVGTTEFALKPLIRP